MKKRAFIYIIITGILWGSSGIFVNLLSPYGFSSWHMTALRGLIATVCISLYMLIRDRSLFKIKPRDILLFIGCGLGMFGTSGCYYAAMQITSISTAVVLLYTAPILVMIFSVAFLGERLTKLKIVSLCSMFIGCCLVSGIATGFKFDIWGILLGLLSGISYAAYNIFTKIEMKKGYSPLTATMYSALFMSLIAFATSHPERIIPLVMQKPSVTIPLMIALGIVTFVLPYFLYSSALTELDAGTASALSIVEPMSATLFSVFIFHEKLDIFSILGIGLILLAVFILSKNESHVESD